MQPAIERGQLGREQDKLCPPAQHPAKKVVLPPPFQLRRAFCSAHTQRQHCPKRLMRAQQGLAARDGPAMANNCI